MIERRGQDGRFARLRARLAQALLREPTVILLERDADAFMRARDPGDLSGQPFEAMR
ncbi:hypothetical protein [Sphingobium terrigena]|uniref:hypothetical protein n=1 Tax=Sphingobium terrigena TaxID=2304063 RepID=UPI00160214E6|nr:hypothetical protein [Sphingobium terrigena]